jgi:hypothetical protein
MGDLWKFCVSWIPGIMKGRQYVAQVSEVALSLKWSCKALSHLSGFESIGMSWGFEYKCSQKVKVHHSLRTIILTL